jgi:hypothetical protein
VQPYTTPQATSDAMHAAPCTRKQLPMGLAQATTLLKVQHHGLQIAGAAGTADVCPRTANRSAEVASSACPSRHQPHAQHTSWTHNCLALPLLTPQQVKGGNQTSKAKAHLARQGQHDMTSAPAADLQLTHRDNHRQYRCIRLRLFGSCNTNTMHNRTQGHNQAPP